MLQSENSNAVRERSSTVRVSIDKELQQQQQEQELKTQDLQNGRGYRKSLSLSKRSSTQTESTCESECETEHERFQEFKTGEPLPKQEDMALSSPHSSEASSRGDCSIHPSEAIYYFGYGAIVNPIVRFRRGCKIPSQNIKSAILYDHRLRFVKGGTANIVPSRGWDVKGVLIRFDHPHEWDAFREYDANYDVREVSVSVIDKTNLDPKHRNDCTSPFEEDEKDHSGSSLIQQTRVYKSCPVGDTLGDFSEYGDDSSDSELEASCPFDFDSKPMGKKDDPNAVKCYTFMMDQPPGHDQPKPQERYLRLMIDGLRTHNIDETYIRDEILSVNYIPKNNDRVVDSFRSFPVAGKLSPVSLDKYKSKLCNVGGKAKDKNKEATYFVCGNRIMKVQSNNPNDPDALDPSNPCAMWLRALAHGKGDITLLVHQTFVDNESDMLHIPFVDTNEELTPQHTEWAEHMILLYLERGGLTASVVSELSSEGKSLRRQKLAMLGKSMANFTAAGKAKRFGIKKTRSRERIGNGSVNPTIDEGVQRLRHSSPASMEMSAAHASTRVVKKKMFGFGRVKSKNTGS